MAEGAAARLWWSVPAVGLVLLVVVECLVGPGTPPARQSSYDASGEGLRAPYVVLQELGYPVTRARRPTGEHWHAGDDVRCVLFPTEVTREAAAVDRWVLDGGTLLLADDRDAFAQRMGIPLKVQTLDMDPGPEPVRDAAGVGQVEAGRTHVDWPGAQGEVWARAGGRPLVTVYSHGDGAIWLVHRPDFLRNRLLGRADNAVLLCRLADAMLDDQSGKLAFDEFFHGMRDRPGVTELILEPPALWVTLQGVLLLVLILGRYVPRFGAVRPPAEHRRRSKEEFLDAMAGLLERKGDYADAWRTVRDDLRRDVERELGLPAGLMPVEVAREAARRRPAGAARLADILVGRPAGGRPAVVQAMNQIEAARDEFFHGRRHR